MALRSHNFLTSSFAERIPDLQIRLRRSTNFLAAVYPRHRQLVVVSLSPPMIHNVFLIRNSGTPAPPLLSTTFSTGSKPQAR
jgi:hypothetical protein